MKCTGLWQLLATQRSFWFSSEERSISSEQCLKSSPHTSCAPALSASGLGWCHRGPRTVQQPAPSNSSALRLCPAPGQPPAVPPPHSHHPQLVDSMQPVSVLVAAGNTAGICSSPASALRGFSASTPPPPPGGPPVLLPPCSQSLPKRPLLRGLCQPPQIGHPPHCHPASLFCAPCFLSLC